MIAGIEPSNSMLITLMIQTKHVLYLKRAAEDTQSIKEWVHFGVDFIKIEGKEYFLKGKIYKGCPKRLWIRQFNIKEKFYLSNILTHLLLQ